MRNSFGIGINFWKKRIVDNPALERNSPEQLSRATLFRQYGDF
jgi:hypothetical protein